MSKYTTVYMKNLKSNSEIHLQPFFNIVLPVYGYTFVITSGIAVRRVHYKSMKLIRKHTMHCHPHFRYRITNSSIMDYDTNYLGLCT